MTKKPAKVVLITGSSSGFENLIAKPSIQKNGFHVIATMRNNKGKNLKVAPKFYLTRRL